MLPALSPRRSGQTHRASRLPAKHASATATGTDGRRNGQPNNRSAQGSNRDRHRPRAETLSPCSGALWASHCRRQRLPPQSPARFRSRNRLRNSTSNSGKTAEAVTDARSPLVIHWREAVSCIGARFGKLPLATLGVVAQLDVIRLQ